MISLGRKKVINERGNWSIDLGGSKHACLPRAYTYLFKLKRTLAALRFNILLLVDDMVSFIMGI